MWIALCTCLINGVEMFSTSAIKTNNRLTANSFDAGGSINTHYEIENKSRKFNPSDYEFPFDKLELIEDSIDLNEEFVECPRSSFLIRVKGNSMINAGIDSGDTLLVDSSRKPVHGNIVVAAINGKITVKRLNYSYRETMLLAENDDYMPIMVKSGDRLKIWGVATMVIKSLI